MGSITKLKRTDKATGKEITVYRAYVRRTGFASKSKVCRTEREAKNWLRNNDADSSLSRPTSGKLFRAFVDEFAAAPPAKGRRYWSMQHLDFWNAQLGAMRLAEISRADINAAKAVLQTQPALRSTPGGPKITGARLAPATVNRYLASLSSIFNYALELELIDAHPMKGGKVTKLEESGGRTRVLTAEEEGRLTDAAMRSTWPMLPLFLRMCLTTAARKSEVLRLKWSQVRLDDSTAILGKTKNGRPRALPLVDDVRAALAVALQARPDGVEHVFFNPRRPGQPFNVDAAWKACREAAGLLKDREDPLDQVVLHTTRHTSVTKMLKGGANLAQAAVVSGHRTLAMLKRYEHLAASDAVELAQKHLGGQR